MFVYLPMPKFLSLRENYVIFVTQANGLVVVVQTLASSSVT